MFTFNRHKSEKEERFTHIVDTYREPVYWFIRRRVVSHDDADDVTQEVFIRIYKNFYFLCFFKFSFSKKNLQSFMINMFQIKTTKGENMTQCKKVTETSTNEKEYEDFLQQLEAKNIIKRYQVKDESGNTHKKWDFKPGLIILN